MTMTKPARLLVAGGALLLAAAVAVAGSNVFTATGRARAATCVAANNKAVHWINQNYVTWQSHRVSPSMSKCDCQGDNTTGWACQVTVSY